VQGSVIDETTGFGVAILSAGDSTYNAGVAGLYVFSNVPNGGADATFDDFQTSIAEPSTTGILLMAGLSLMGWRVCAQGRKQGTKNMRRQQEG
jgi:hypothetical protein